MCATPLAPTGGTTLGQVPSRSRSSAARLTRPEWCALSSLPFYTAARGTRGWLPTVLHSQNEECMCVCLYVCEFECVWQGSVRCLSLVCFELFHASCFDLLSHLFIPHAPCASGFWFAHRQRSRRGMGGGHGAASHTDTTCSVNIERGAGRAAHGAQPPGAECKWVEGSPGAKVMHTVQFSAPLLCSLRSSNSGLKFLCEKQLPLSLEGGLLTPYNMGKCTPQLVVI